MVQPIQRVNLDLTATMLEELDRLPRTSMWAAKLSSRRWSDKLSTNIIWHNARSNPSTKIFERAWLKGRLQPAP